MSGLYLCWIESGLHGRGEEEDRLPELNSDEQEEISQSVEIALTKIGALFPTVVTNFSELPKGGKDEFGIILRDLLAEQNSSARRLAAMVILKRSLSNQPELQMALNADIYHLNNKLQEEEDAAGMVLAEREVQRVRAELIRIFPGRGEMKFSHERQIWPIIRRFVSSQPGRIRFAALVRLRESLNGNPKLQGVIDTGRKLGWW
jgi:hypothetical protein